MVWIDPNKPLEAAKELLHEARKRLGKNQTVLADRLIAEALTTLKWATESSTTQTSAKSITAEFAANCDKESE